MHLREWTQEENTIKAETESVEKSNTISPPPLKDIMFVLFPIFSQVQTLLL